jgi:hypothetical protein
MVMFHSKHKRLIALYLKGFMCYLWLSNNPQFIWALGLRATPRWLHRSSWTMVIWEDNLMLSSHPGYETHSWKCCSSKAICPNYSTLCISALSAFTLPTAVKTVPLHSLCSEWIFTFFPTRFLEIGQWFSRLLLVFPSLLKLDALCVRPLSLQQWFSHWMKPRENCGFELLSDVAWEL